MANAAPSKSADPITRSDFIFSDSDSRLLTSDDLRRLSKEDFRIARNEIFARRGRYFSSPDLTQRFSKFAWYAPRTWEPQLNAFEQANVALLDNAQPASSARSDFLIPDSDRRILTMSDLKSLSREELRIARNEIFARRGRYFEAADLKSRFGRFSWYVPNTWNPKLSSIERANITLMDQFENR